jgi:Cdc6-like AAA superfamily ATPase
VTTVDLVLQSKIKDSFRTSKVRGQFDIPAGQGAVAVHLHAELPLDARPWHVGLITGASGTGKTSIARESAGRL